ncbi:MAG: hypothetical protein ABI647_11805 [Gemmatimonadota bacterium]
MLLLTAIAAVLMTAASDSLGNRLETGCSGGVTGGGGGTIVTEDGRFFNYVRTTGKPEPSVKLIGRDGPRAAAYFKAAERAGLTRIKYREPSNMTCHLSLTRGAKRSEVAWPIGSRPKKIAKLIDLAEAMKGKA